MRWLFKLLHLHIWNIDPRIGSKGHLHLCCRCGKTKRVPI